MRNKETLIHELQLIAKCSEETTEVWWKSLNLKERTVLAEYLKEMIESIALIAPPLSTWAIAMIKSLIEKLSPETKKLFQEMSDMIADFEGDNAKSTS